MSVDEDIRAALAARRNTLYLSAAQQDEVVTATRGFLARVTAERDALARHIEQLIAPVTQDEARAFPLGTAVDEIQAALDKFIAARQRKGQFAALS